MTTTSVSLPDTEIHSLHSDIIGDDFEIWIARPQAGFAPLPPGPTAVLYVLDANLCFGTAVEMTRIMHKLYGELPPLLIVGIAYPTDNGFLQGALRTRDFTPSADASLAAMADSLPKPAQSFQVEPSMGGGDRFLQFLQSEVKPFVSSRFEVASQNSTIFGSSLGGLLVTYALLTAPKSFDNFIAVSPSLWWDNEMMFCLESAQAEKARSNAQGDRQPKVFLAVGELEETPEIPMLARFKTVTNVHRMADQLGCWETLSVQSAVISGETHTSVIPAALTRGLRSCLPSGQVGSVGSSRAGFNRGEQIPFSAK